MIYSVDSHSIVGWTTRDYDNMSWHDCHVHGFHITDRELALRGRSNLEFDIDFICELIPTATTGVFNYMVAPVTLTFYAVRLLKIELDYSALTAAITPFRIVRIERNVERKNKQFITMWRIVIGWPEGEIRFQSSGFEQDLRMQPICTARQYLTTQQRTTKRPSTPGDA